MVRDVIPFSDSVVMVTWDLPSGETTNGDAESILVYILYGKGQDGEVEVTEEHTAPGNATSLTVSNLQSSRQYEATIQVLNSAGASPFSPRFPFTTGGNVQRMRANNCMIQSFSNPHVLAAHEGCHGESSCPTSQQCYRSTKGIDTCLIGKIGDYTR